MEHIVLLPEVEHSDHLALLLLRALVQVVEGDLGVLGKSRGKHIFIWPELMPALPHYGVNHV